MSTHIRLSWQNGMFDRLECLDRLKCLDRLECQWKSFDRLEIFDRLEFLNRLECLHRLECLNRLECQERSEWHLDILVYLDILVCLDCLDLMYLLVALESYVWVCGWMVHLDCRVSSSPFFEIHYEIWVSLWDIWPFCLGKQGPELDNLKFMSGI